jgi:S-adenosylmethionine/arginine decarboxylase-like enzyme
MGSPEGGQVQLLERYAPQSMIVVMIAIFTLICAGLLLLLHCHISIHGWIADGDTCNNVHTCNQISPAAL